MLNVIDTDESIEICCMQWNFYGSCKVIVDTVLWTISTSVLIYLVVSCPRHGVTYVYGNKSCDDNSSGRCGLYSEGLEVHTDC